MNETMNEQPQPEGVIMKVPQLGQSGENNAPLGEKTGVEVAPRQSDGERKQHRSFCSPILIFFSALGSLFAGMISLSATAGQGMSKFYWHIPVLYGDKTAREWPEITGFRSGCAAGGKVRIIYLNSKTQFCYH